MVFCSFYDGMSNVNVELTASYLKCISTNGVDNWSLFFISLPLFENIVDALREGLQIDIINTDFTAINTFVHNSLVSALDGFGIYVIYLAISDDVLLIGKMITVKIITNCYFVQEILLVQEQQVHRRRR